MSSSFLLKKCCCNSPAVAPCSDFTLFIEDTGEDAAPYDIALTFSNATGLCIKACEGRVLLYAVADCTVHITWGRTNIGALCQHYISPWIDGAFVNWDSGKAELYEGTPADLEDDITLQAGDKLQIYLRNTGGCLDGPHDDTVYRAAFAFTDPEGICPECAAVCPDCNIEGCVKPSSVLSNETFFAPCGGLTWPSGWNGVMPQSPFFDLLYEAVLTNARARSLWSDQYCRWELSFLVFDPALEDFRAVWVGHLYQCDPRGNYLRASGCNLTPVINLS